MMEEYLHYGKKVTYIYCDGYDYREILRRKNIEYEDIPLLDNEYRMIRYNNHYAMIKPLPSYDDCSCSVYIFDDIPEDLLFYLIARDIDNQREGYEPMKKNTKAYILIQEAACAVVETAEKDACDPLGFPVSSQESICKASAEYIQDKYNITRAEFAILKHDDCNIEMFESIRDFMRY